MSEVPKIEMTTPGKLTGGAQELKIILSYSAGEIQPPARIVPCKMQAEHDHRDDLFCTAILGCSSNIKNAWGDSLGFAYAEGATSFIASCTEYYRYGVNSLGKTKAQEAISDCTLAHLALADIFQHRMLSTEQHCVKARYTHIDRGVCRAMLLADSLISDESSLPTCMHLPVADPRLKVLCVHF